MSAKPSPELAIRPMTERDVPAVMAVELEAYPFPWTAGIFRDCIRSGYRCLVAERGGEVLGYAVLSIAVGEAHLLNLCVSPRQQSQGLGRRLLEQVLELSRALGADTMFLEVRPSNVHAIALYVSAGFCEVGTRRGYYPAASGREDALVMARVL